MISQTRVLMRSERECPSRLDGFCRQSLLSDNTGPDGIINIMIDISYNIRDLADLAFQEWDFAPVFSHYFDYSGLGMIQNAVPHFPGQIQSLAVVFQKIHNPQALFIMPESAGEKLIQDIFSDMAERGMSQIMAQ